MSLIEISLTEPNLLDNVKKQFFYKLKARMGMFLALVVVQVMALLFSLGGVMSYGMGSEYVNLSVSVFSSEMVIWFTFIWIFVVAILITNKDYQNIDFTFVSNRLSSNLSNVGFLVTAALIGGVTAMLSGFILRIVVYITHGSAHLFSRNFIVTPEVLFTGIAVTLLYLLLFGALGYLCGALVQLSRVFVLLLPGAFFGLFERGNQLPVLLEVIEFFSKESSLVLLAVKIILTIGLLYACSFVVSNRLEVR